MLGPYLLGPNDENQGVYTGDARELALAIPNESVDLVFTDPVYQNIEDYRWLAETAARVLKPDSACLAWCSNVKQYEVKAIMDEHLHFVLPLQYVVIGKVFRLMYYHTFVWTTPCLWFEKGRALPSRWIADTCTSTNATAKDNGHQWHKNPEAYLNWLGAFCPPGGIVADFFTGGGTVPAVCKMLGRQWLAFEIDPHTADLARERVRNTQPPLFVPEPQQAMLELAGVK